MEDMKEGAQEEALNLELGLIILKDLSQQSQPMSLENSAAREVTLKDLSLRSQRMSLGDPSVDLVIKDDVILLQSTKFLKDIL